MKLTNYMREAFVNAAMDDVPKTDFDKAIKAQLLVAAVATMPPEVARAYKKHPGWFNNEGRNLPNLGWHYLPIPSSQRLDPERLEVIRQIDREKSAQALSMTSLRSKLKGVASGCSTRKQLAEALPEFVKYLPPEGEAATKNLPALANVVSAFVAAGWPKGEKK